jgi:hypothetical protein
LKPLYEIIISMSITEIIIHRGNSPVNKTEPLEQVNYYVEAGFKKIEIDIYATSETTYKFCHPLDRDKIDEIHNIKDGFLEMALEQFPDVQWYVDLKCLDLDTLPFKLLQYLTDVFGNTGIFTAAQHEILEFANKVNRKTAQYFKNNISSDLDYTPDLFVHNDTENKTFQKKKTIVYCPDSKVALNYLSEGYAGVMVDGNKLTAF